MNNVKVKAKPVVKYTMTGSAESHALTVLRTRDLLDISDEPEERGGTNEGFAPTEFVLGGLLACTNVISHKIAAASGFTIKSLEVRLEASFNRLGVNLSEHVRVPFPEIRLHIAVDSDASADQQEILMRDLPKYCAVSNVLRESGTTIYDEWSFVN
jgi:uncharacterized OsmC-like protein